MNKEDLKDCLNINEWELDESLRNCQISTDKTSYEESDKDLLKQYRDLVVAGGEAVASLYREEIKVGRTPTEALTQLAQVVAPESNPQTPSAPKVKERYSGKVPVALFDLLQAGKELTGKPIGLSRALELLQVSGLSEQSEYAQEEADRFLETCDLIINQGKSLAEVTQKNGVKLGASTFKRVERIASENATTFESELVTGTTDLDERIAQTYRHAYLGRLEEIFISGEFEQACQEARQKRGNLFGDLIAEQQLWMSEHQQHHQKRIEEVEEYPQLPESD